MPDKLHFGEAVFCNIVGKVPAGSEGPALEASGAAEILGGVFTIRVTGLPSAVNRDVSGEGPVATDGSFSFSVPYTNGFAPAGNFDVTGVIAPDASGFTATLSNLEDIGPVKLTGKATPGVNSMDACRQA